jgi:hypothetical protein
MQRPTLYSCFFYFFVPSETLFTSFTKENHQQRQQLLVFMQRRSEHLPLLLPLKLFPQYSPKNTNQEKQLLYAKKIKTFASSSSFASSSLTTSTLFTQKHQPRTTTTSLCKEDQNICFFFFLLLLLSHTLHILHKIILTKAATATSVSERSNTFVFLPSVSNYLHILHKITPTTTTTTVTSLCKKDQN